ncbi:putative proteinase inhibitor I3, Kunitz legume [Rosa chinensis]|uniref:Kunitz type trypsin inhibitor / Alpha-fucosidase n=1 Tax=Rosa chinensis TaxID=74649 RepID=A0A2P6P1G2_ROSCH|nr:kunitz trypsin inhibitor 5 isoform X1 [Rosa chinensis]PRQ15766.1 putative proteinase inhibitor I3, Kunitz legume [Rosa chinensis]
MRPCALASLAFICYLSFFAFRDKALLVAADAAPAPVLDIKGDNLRSGVEYWILPVIRGRGGGLTLATAGNRNKTNCPLDVVQEQHEVSNGLPLTLSPVNLKKGVVHLSTDLNIKFSISAAVIICLETSKVRKLDNFDESAGQWFVTSGGVEGNPGPKTISNWFKIEKYDDDYKLVFCPTVCNFCKVLCRDVGIYLEDGIRRLALSDVPIKVMFKRV